MDLEYHPPGPKEDFRNRLAELDAKANVEVLLQMAREATAGLDCEIDLHYGVRHCSSRAKHVNVRILVPGWGAILARIACELLSYPYTYRYDDTLATECATLVQLASMGIPAPRVLATWPEPPRVIPGSTSEVIDCLMIKELRGRPFDRRIATREQKLRVFDQMARFMLLSLQTPFPAIGTPDLSLHPRAIGPIPRRSCFFSRHGPYISARRYYSVLLDEYVEFMNRVGPLSKRELPQEYRIWALEGFGNLRSMINSRTYDTFDLNTDHGPFYLKLTDGKSNRVFIDDEYRITGIVGWGSARAVPIYDAFGPSVFTANERDPLLGANDLGNDDGLFAEALLRIPFSYTARYMVGRDCCRRLQVMFDASSQTSFKHIASMLVAALKVFGNMSSAEVEELVAPLEWNMDIDQEE